jgi:ABC-type transport system involved in multi-copper enzyme maturation permease subunit
MSLPAALFAIRWLIRDTFLQAMASGIFWLMLVVSGLCILFCLSVHVQGDTPLQTPGELPSFINPRDPAAKDPSQLKGVDIISGELSFLFGAIRVPISRDARSDVRFLQLLLAGGVADVTGLLLALIWTAGFLPTFLDPSAASVLLAKPVPRWSLLIGKYLGVLSFVLFQAVVFIGGTWLALGLRTGIWEGTYWLAVPILLLHFAIFFSFSTFLAVLTRSTVVCVFGSILFWLMCWGMNFGRHAVIAAADQDAATAAMQRTVEIAYWILPKPADMGIFMYNALDAGHYFSQALAFQTVQKQGAFHPELSLLASLAFTAVLLGLSAYQLQTTDY